MPKHLIVVRTVVRRSLWLVALGALPVVTLAQQNTRPALLTEQELNFEGIKAYIARQSLSSIDDLIANLPENCRAKYTLVHHSKSPEKNSANYDKPRTILSCRGGQMLFAFTGDPAKAEDFNKLQIIEFDATQSKFFPRQILTGANGRLITDERPQSCANCHGEDARPIWDSYPYWPGFYSSDEGHMGKEEKARFLKFKAENRNRGRYALLVDPPRPTNEYVNGGGIGLVHDIGAEEFPFVANGRNPAINIDILNLAGERATRLLTSSPKYQDSLYQIAWILACQRFRRNETNPFKEEINAMLSADLKKRMQEIEEQNGTIRQPYNEPHFADLEDAYSLARVAGAVGVDPFELGTQFSRKTFSFFGGDLLSNLKEHILGDLAIADAQIATRINRAKPSFFAKLKELKDPQTTRERRQKLYGILSNYKITNAFSEWPEMCSYLRSKFTYEPPLPLLTRTPSTPVKEASKELKHTLLTSSHVPESCIACHANPPLDTIPWIPYDKPERLKEMLKRDKILLEKTRNRTEANTHKDLRMPLGGNALSETERETLLDYLESLAREISPKEEAPPLNPAPKTEIHESR